MVVPETKKPRTTRTEAGRVAKRPLPQRGSRRKRWTLSEPARGKGNRWPFSRTRARFPRNWSRIS